MLNVISELLLPCRQHDIRLSLNHLQIVLDTDPHYRPVKRLLKTVTYSDPGTLTFVASAQDWTVNYIRHKVRKGYVVDDKYIVTVSNVREYRVDWEKLDPDSLLTVKPEDYETHSEVEVRSNVVLPYNS